MNPAAISRTEDLGILRAPHQALPDNLTLAFKPAWALATDQQTTAEDAQEAVRLALEASAGLPGRGDFMDVRVRE